MALELPPRLSQQRRRGRQIGFGLGHAGMAEIGGQQRQQPLHVPAPPVALGESFGGEAGAQVVQARLVASPLRAQQAGGCAHVPEGV